jgi:hypothetical protein
VRSRDLISPPASPGPSGADLYGACTENGKRLHDRQGADEGDSNEELSRRERRNREGVSHCVCPFTMRGRLCLTRISLGRRQVRALPCIARKNTIRAWLTASPRPVVRCKTLARFVARRAAWCVRRGGRNVGYKTTAANLTLVCRAHNLHAAEQDFGREHIDRKVAASRLGGNPGAAPTTPGVC